MSNDRKNKVVGTSDRNWISLQGRLGEEPNQEEPNQIVQYTKRYLGTWR